VVAHRQHDIGNGERESAARACCAPNQALGWLAVSIAGIGGWSRLFFGRRSLPASTVASAALLGTATAFVGKARRTDRISAMAALPLVGWVAFATILTADIWRRNR